MSDIHSCSYYCSRPACVLAQRDELRDAIEALRAELAAARALLRACLPELDGEGVTIHRVWAALAAPGEGK